MKTLIQFLKVAVLLTAVSFVMSCDKNNKRTNNNLVGNSIYTYGVNGQCINNQTGQLVNPTLCQQNYNNGYGLGQMQCNGNPSLFVWGVPDQTCASQPQQSSLGYGCWKSCAYTNCSGQIAYQGGSTNMQQGYRCL